MKTQPEFVTLQIRTKGKTADAADPFIGLLARILNRPIEVVCRGLEPGPLTLRKVFLNDDLKRLVVALERNGFAVRVFAMQPAPQEGDKPDTPEELQESRTVRVSYKDGVRNLWNKGDVIDGLYEVHGSAAGGMGRVYFVFHRLWKMMLAMKTPQAAAVKSVTDLKRFLREAEYWVHLGLHPNIATCYYVRVLNGLPRMFIEYVDGGCLKDWRDQNPAADLKIITDLMLQFCHGMIHAEEHGMIHRDIKPANCLINRDGTMKITDFGLVKRVDTPDKHEAAGDPLPQVERSEAAGVTQYGGKIVGSPWYMAPERFRRNRQEDIRSDIYSFGVMLYEVVLGRMPYTFPDGFSLEKLVRSQIKKAPTDPILVRPDLPKKMAEIIVTCLKKKPENRFSSFVEVCTALENLYRSLVPNREARKRPNVLALKADSLNNQAVSLLDLGREDEAVQLLEEAHSADTEHLQAVYNLHTLRWARGESSDHEVVRSMTSLKIEVRDTPDYWHFMGLISLQRGDPSYAVPLLRKAAQQSPQYAARWKSYEDDPQKFVDAVQLEPIEQVGNFAGHVKRVLSLAFALNEEKAFSVGEDRFIRVWDIKSGRCLKTLKGFSMAPVAGAFSPTGTIAATGYGDAYKTVDLWDLSTGRPIRRYQGIAAFGLRFSGDSTRLAVCGDDSRVKVLDTGANKTLWETPEQPARAVCAELLPEGQAVVVGYDDGSLVRWPWNSPEPVFRIKAHEGSVPAIAVSPDGALVASGGVDEALRVSDATSGQEVAVFLGHKFAPVRLQFMPDGKYLLSGSGDGTLKIWSLVEKKCCRTLTFPGQELSQFALSEDGTRLLTGGSRGAMLLWSISTGWFAQKFLEPAICRPRTFQELARLHTAFRHAMERFDQGRRESDAKTVRESFEQIRSLPGFSWSKEAIRARNLLVHTSKGSALRSWAFVRAIRCHEDEVVSLAPSEDSLRLLTGSLDGTAALLDVVTGKRIMSVRPGAPVYEVFLLPQGRALVTWSADEILRLWDPSGKSVRRFEGVRRPVSLEDGGRTMVAVSQDAIPLRIDLESGDMALDGAKIEGSDPVCFHTDLTVLYCLRHGTRIQRLDRSTGNSLGAFRDVGVNITAINPTAQGDRVLTGMETGEISVYIVGSGMNVATLRGHVDAVRTLTEWPHGNVWATGSDDFTVRVWDLATETCLALLEGHSSPVRAVRFFPNCSMIASGSGAGSVRLWGLEWELPQENLLLISPRS